MYSLTLKLNFCTLGGHRHVMSDSDSDEEAMAAAAQEALQRAQEAVARAEAHKQAKRKKRRRSNVHAARCDALRQILPVVERTQAADMELRVREALLPEEGSTLDDKLSVTATEQKALEAAAIKHWEAQHQLLLSRHLQQKRQQEEEHERQIQELKNAHSGYIEDLRARGDEKKKSIVDAHNAAVHEIAKLKATVQHCNDELREKCTEFVKQLVPEPPASYPIASDRPVEPISEEAAAAEGAEAADQSTDSAEANELAAADLSNTPLVSDTEEGEAVQGGAARGGAVGETEVGRVADAGHAPADPTATAAACENTTATQIKITVPGQFLRR